MAGVRHWRRRLKNGNIQYYFTTGCGDTVYGAAPDDAGVDDAIASLARRSGVPIPEPEWKKPRGKRGEKP